MQGNPYDHSPNLNAVLNQYINKGFNDFSFLSEKVIKCNLSGCKYHPDLPLIQVYRHLFKEKKKMDFIFGSGAQFIVSKKNILKRPREFYLEIVKMLQYSICPQEGYVIERFHKLILDNFEHDFTIMF